MKRDYLADRQFYIGGVAARRVAHKASDAVAYLYESNGRPYAIAFCGKRGKPDWHYRFRSDAKREERIREHFAARAEQLAAAQRHKAKPRALEVGDILRCSWGYDQTNIDYYQVTALIGRTMVELRAIGAEVVDGEAWAQGYSAPLKDHFIGEPFRRRADGEAVRIASYASAYKMAPKATVAGVAVYDRSHWTAYA